MEISEQYGGTVTREFGTSQDVVRGSYGVLGDLYLKRRGRSFMVALGLRFSHNSLAGIQIRTG